MNTMIATFRSGHGVSGEIAISARSLELKNIPEISDPLAYSAESL